MKVRITLLEEALGSSPSNEDLLGTYIASKAPTEELEAQEIETIKAQNAEERLTVFPKLPDGTPFIYDYQIKGMLKDSCKMLAKAGKAGYPGGKACAAIKAYKQAIDGLILRSRAASLTTCTGSRWITASAFFGQTPPWESEPALQRARVCLDPKLEDMVRECLDYGKFRGLGQWRNSGKGRFAWDLLDASGAVIGGNNEFEE